tara:strand:- start:41 stop:376 length:336 start_codon:yes stop_codon:yes gene_type:complete
MKMETELMIYKHIVEEYGHLDFTEIKEGNRRDSAGEMIDCVMMEHGIRDVENWVKEQYTIKEMMRRHYMFRWFFDKDNVWWDCYVEMYDRGEPKGVMKEFDIEEMLEKFKD